MVFGRATDHSCHLKKLTLLWAIYYLWLIFLWHDLNDVWNNLYLHRRSLKLLNLSLLAPFISSNSSLSLSPNSSIWSSVEKFYEPYYSFIESNTSNAAEKNGGVFNLSSSGVNNFWQLAWSSAVTCTSFSSIKLSFDISWSTTSVPNFGCLEPSIKEFTNSILITLQLSDVVVVVLDIKFDSWDCTCFQTIR